MRLETVTGQVGFGEIAPVPWFPVETLEQAKNFLKGLSSMPRPITPSVPDNLPCTQFALATALQQSGLPAYHRSLPCAGLLSAGDTALEQLGPLLDAGYTTFKWKVGVHTCETEWRIAKQLFAQLHGKGVLRMDANGGLTREDFAAWCHFLSEFPIDYMEQPLPVGLEVDTVKISADHGIRIAFDESACTSNQLKALAKCHPEAIYVIKPSQAGEPYALAAWLSGNPHIRRVYSWAFETHVGFASVVNMALSDAHCSEAAGFGGAALFTDDAPATPSGPIIQALDETPETLWECLPC